jgi:hypothetical protein
MSTLEGASRRLEPFSIGLYLRPNEIYEPNVVAPHALPTPLLDPETVQAAMIAYHEAADTLRTRARSALKPAVRHTLANRILALAIFGERDHRLLSDRALAHFP